MATRKKKTTNPIVTEVIKTKSKPKPIEKRITVRIKAKYLPDILVKLSEAEANAEARNIIRKMGVTINDIVVTDIDFPLKRNTTINLDVNNIKYEVNLI